MEKELHWFCPESITSWIPHVLQKIELENSGYTKLIRTLNINDANFIWIHHMRNDIRYLRTQTGKSDSRKLIVGGVGISGTHILEDKVNLALVQRSCRIKNSVLKSFVVESSVELEAWMKRYLQDQGLGSEVWIIKDAGANCGEGLWVLSSFNKQEVLEQIKECSNWKSKNCYLIQKYLEKPKLWENKYKFHYRMYLILRGDGACFLYREFLVHIANKEYSLNQEELADKQVHITNTAVNKEDKERFHGCPVHSFSENLTKELTSRILETLADILISARPFMKYQTSAEDFSHIGVDIIIDSFDRPYVLEANVPPCAGMYGEDMGSALTIFFKKMFTDIVNHFVLGPQAFEDTWITLVDADKDFSPCSPSQTGLNGLRWALHRRITMKEREAL